MTLLEGFTDCGLESSTIAVSSQTGQESYSCSVHKDRCLMKLSDCRLHLLTYLITPGFDCHLNNQLY